MQAAPASQPGRVRIVFSSFTAQVLDRYDWDYSEHLTVPNPDFGSKEPDAVTPKSDRVVVVYHKNAERLEKASLAAPYDVRSKSWAVTDAAVTAPAEIDPRKSL